MRRVARPALGKRRDLADQLRRAAASITLNIAEGTGEFSPAEKVRFYRIARRSAYECDAALDLIERLVEDAPPTREARDLLSEVVGTLTKTIHAIELRRSG